MILEIKSKVDYINKCGNCKYFKTDDNIYGECINTENKIKSLNRYRQYNSRSCVCKETISNG